MDSPPSRWHGDRVDVVAGLGEGVLATSRFATAHRDPWARLLVARP